MRTEGIFHEVLNFKCNLYQNKKIPSPFFQYVKICTSITLKCEKVKEIDRGNLKKNDFENCLFLGY